MREQPGTQARAAEVGQQAEVGLAVIGVDKHHREGPAGQEGEPEELVEFSQGDHKTLEAQAGAEQGLQTAATPGCKTLNAPIPLLDLTHHLIPDEQELAEKRQDFHFQQEIYAAIVIGLLRHTILQRHFGRETVRCL
jgi:hypothetical protein